MATSSLGLFAIVWAAICLIAGAVVFDAMIRQSEEPRLDLRRG